MPLTPTTRIDHVYVDANALLHTAIRTGTPPAEGLLHSSLAEDIHLSLFSCSASQCTGPPCTSPLLPTFAASTSKQFHRHLHQKLNEVLETTKPTKTLMISVGL